MFPESETALTVQQLRGKISGDQKPAVETVHRWAREGILVRDTGMRVYLEVRKVGGRMFTSWEAFERFIDAINQTPSPERTTDTHECARR